MQQIAHIEAAINPLDTLSRRLAYQAGNFPNADVVKDLNKRYRWDLLWAARYDVTPLYQEGCNDSHIDTALRCIVARLDTPNYKEVG